MIKYSIKTKLGHLISIPKTESEADEQFGIFRKMYSFFLKNRLISYIISERIARF